MALLDLQTMEADETTGTGGPSSLSVLSCVSAASITGVLAANTASDAAARRALVLSSRRNGWLDKGSCVTGRLTRPVTVTSPE